MDELRRDYRGVPLDEAEAGDDPFELFGRWFEAAVAFPIELANGMVLATAGAGGAPAARVVLLKGWDRSGFVFFTHHGSRKGTELEANPAVALLFWWVPMARQIRIEGRASRIASAESDAYFASRPRDSNLSAMASEQSRPVAGRDALEERYAQWERAWHGHELVRPEGWGGYRVAAEQFEFWQGRPSRLHDRLVYRLNADLTWTRERLYP
ncbi:MAG TPA: pyridoxamine 5'-phosphate oxidase [Kofleriaceae bacterium]|nr:pyridoxamine 5'-phosphate oxidase [Kofleriaceae bacterium]